MSPPTPTPSSSATSSPPTLSSPLAKLPGITARQAEALATLGLTNLGRLIAHLPMRHERHEAESSVREIVPGHIVSARGEITATRTMRRGRAPRFEAVLIDDTGRLDLVWFNQTFLEKRIRPGLRLRVQGTAKKLGPGVQLANPTYEILKEEKPEPGERARVRPVYPASEACPSKVIELAIQAVLELALPLLDDHLTVEFRRERNLPSLAEAYRMVHMPRDEGDAGAGRRRLAYDELLLLQLGVQMKRAHLRGALKAPALKHSAAIDRHIRERFPFMLTPSQDAVVAEIARDLSKSTPTNRLIQGDVGSGKTVVALYGMLMAVAAGQQAAIMSPTELLAEQHFASISAMLAGSRVKMALLTGSTPESEREGILAGLASGGVDLVVGTHALLTESVKFKSLGVAVIDEQHRFGVHQRARLRAKGAMAPSEHEKKGEITPHVLVMTATPIPRTMAITLFGDLDISVIAGLPPGRRAVKTRVVEAPTRGAVYDFVRTRLDAGEQAFIVVPLIDGGIGAAAAGEESPGALTTVRSLMKELEEGPLAGKRLAALHGRLKHTTRETVMERFRSGQIDALVATTVIEVGVDVPNATLMIVEHADRFGLAQLHQLRGRVGRGTKDSVCVLIADALTEEAKQRLEVMASVNDGFVLAEKDFEIRGFGEVFGTRQSGLPPFKVADLSRDRDLLTMARRDGAAWIERSPTLSRPEEALVRRRLVKAYGESLGLADVG